MLSIRFQRVGKKHNQNYRIIVAERRSKLNGPPIEYLGHYNPFIKKGEVSSERVQHWIQAGASPSISVHNLLVRLGIFQGKKIPVHIKNKRNAENHVDEENRGDKKADDIAAGENNEKSDSSEESALKTIEAKSD